MHDKQPTFDQMQQLIRATYEIATAVKDLTNTLKRLNNEADKVNVEKNS